MDMNYFLNTAAQRHRVFFFSSRLLCLVKSSVSLCLCVQLKAFLFKNKRQKRLLVINHIDSFIIFVAYIL